MKINILTMVTIIISALTTLAQKQNNQTLLSMQSQQCVQFVTNADLLNELNRRLNYSTPQVEEPRIGVLTSSHTCNLDIANKNVDGQFTSDLVITTTNNFTFETKVLNLKVHTHFECEKLRTILNGKLSPHTEKNMVVATCFKNKLIKILIDHKQQISLLPSVDLDYQSCWQTAKQLNALN